MKYKVIEKDNKYYIYKKGLFKWKKAKIKHGYRMPTSLGYSSEIMLSKGIFPFKSQEEADENLEKFFINPYEEWYKGFKIIRVLDSTFTERYINKSNVVSYYGGTKCYQSSKSLDELKQKIDEYTS